MLKCRQILAYENPTGVCYDADNEILYIANYNHHNILCVRLKGSMLYGEIEEQMTHPDLVSPENISVKNDYIAVADL